ncbi:MAG: DEAD/DEAH box helicase [Candidatus Kapabacteria bacterium]|nr:DEAD/DEAH box helicase [Candidatus Kapabacteria bacterium]
MTLRPYQARFKQAIYSSFRNNHYNVMGVLPTGGGKTHVFSSIVQDCTNKGHKTLILAHREELIGQAYDKLSSGYDLEVGVIKAGYTPNLSAPVQVASVQTLIRRDLKIPFKLIIVDEAHHDQKNNTYGKIRDKIKEHSPDLRVLGVTATPIRLNGSGFKDVYDDMVIGATVKELIELGNLVAPKYLIHAPVDLNGVKKTAGDYNLKQLAESYRAKMPPEILVEDHLKYFPNKQTVVFAINIEHSQDIVSAYKYRGIRAAHIDGDTPNDVRKAIFRDFAEKRITVLSNFGIVTEGYDCPGIEAIQLARPTESLALYMQMGGRGLRPADGKEQAIISDWANAIMTHGKLEFDRDWGLGGLSGKYKKRVKALDKLTGKIYSLERLPMNIPPEWLELIEVDDKQIHKANEYNNIVGEFKKLQFTANQRGFKPKWIFWRLMDKYKPKTDDKMTAIATVFAEHLEWKPTAVPHLVREYKQKIG